MRRHASSTPWGERVILGAYWLTSGYGLRGLHALGCLDPGSDLRRDYPRSEAPPGAASRARRWCAAWRAAWATT
jgi:hypothetical protein